MKICSLSEKKLRNVGWTWELGLGRWQKRIIYQIALFYCKTIDFVDIVLKKKSRFTFRIKKNVFTFVMQPATVRLVKWLRRGTNPRGTIVPLFLVLFFDFKKIEIGWCNFYRVYDYTIKITFFRNISFFLLKKEAKNTGINFLNFNVVL